jgi:integrase
MGKLTVHKVKALSRPGKYGDGGNLILVIKETSAKFWVFRYTHDGREHALGLGPVRDVDLAAAREKAADARKLLRAGRDPIAEKGTARVQRIGARTFAEVARDFHASHSREWRNAKHRAQWLTSLENYVFPKIGSLPVAAIDTPAILAALKPIWETKYDTARRVSNRIEKVLDVAKARGLRSGENPARWDGLLEHLLPARAATEKKHLAALPWREMPDFMNRLRYRVAEKPGSLDLDTLALEFLILTAARTNEVRFATWDEIAGDTWIIPAARIKAGKEHRVPLSGRVQELLATLPRDNGPFLFPGATADKVLSHNAMLRVLERLGVSSTVHGFRSSFRDWAGESTSFPNHVIEQALAHSLGRVEKAYRRGDLLDKRRKLMDAWSAYLAAPSAEKVVQIRGRA